MDPDDELVGEYPVYLCHTMPEELHVMQFPCVPFDRAKVIVQPRRGRVRPEHRKLELEMNDDEWRDTETFEPDDDLETSEARKGRQPRKFTSDFVEAKSQYCAGIFTGEGDQKALHIVPLTGFFAMRPSLRHVHKQDDAAAKPAPKPWRRRYEDPDARQLVTTRHEKAETDRSKARSERAYQTMRDDIEGEDWVELSYANSQSDLSENIMSRLLAAQTSPDQRASYQVPPANYLNAWSPGGFGRSSDALDAVKAADKYRDTMIQQNDPDHMDDVADEIDPVFKIRGTRSLFTFASLNSMTGIEQVKAVLKHTQVISFKRLKELCNSFIIEASNNEETANRNLVKALDNHAHFVAGRWVVKSADVCSVANGQPPSFRDRLLLELASNNGAVDRAAVSKILKCSPKHCLLFLGSLARLNVDTREWEFKIPYDQAFADAYTVTAKKQTTLWASAAKRNQIVSALLNDLNQGYRLRPSTNSQVFTNMVGGVDENEEDGDYTMGGGDADDNDDSKSRDLHVKGNIQTPLMSALEHHGVQAYGDLSKIASNHAGESVSRAVVQSALKDIATQVKINGKPLYVLKRHIEENGERRQQLREIVLELYGGKGKNDGGKGYKKSDIINYAKSQGMETVPASLFNTVIKEFATSVKTLWVFKMSKEVVKGAGKGAKISGKGKGKKKK